MARLAVTPRAKAARARRAVAALQLPRVEVLALSTAVAHLRFNDLAIVSEANSREPWQLVTKRKQAQRERVELAFKAMREQARAWPVAPPRGVLFVRLGKQLLDEDDNLNGSFKWVRDAIARAFNVTDGPGGPVTWRYAQRLHDVLGCELFIEW